MTNHSRRRAAFFVPMLVLLGTPATDWANLWANDPATADLTRQAQEILKANCHRCHGQDGAAEGGFNYLLDRDRLVARKKLTPGDPGASPLFQKVFTGKMPPPGETPRPSEADVQILKSWIESGAGAWREAASDEELITEAHVYDWMLADLEKLERRARRFQRYLSLAHLRNAGLGADELQTYRHALSKLMNSLSWHPRITAPAAVDPAKVLLRIDLRDFLWDANLWNRVLSEYPYGIFADTATARACTVATGTRMPLVRGDWFLATASRPSLYHDLLQLPTTAAELERLLRVDVNLNIQQERVARAGFNGSGISRSNRLIERHDAVHGAYWRTYDFDAVPQNLNERENLLPDRRNLFAHPLGPAFVENAFQHAGGEIIFNLPNGLQGYLLVNAAGLRIDKAPVAIVSDPKRPDRAVETGLSCMSCHTHGIIPKSDQIRAFVEKNPKAFSRNDAGLIRSLYVPEKKMQGLMEEDSQRFVKALEQTGSKAARTEPTTLAVLRYEADLDLTAAASELGLKPEDFVQRLSRQAALDRNLGALKAAGGTVQRQVFVQAFADVVKEFRLGTLMQPALASLTLPDNTGEVDPLETQGNQANAMAFSADGRFALFAGADKSVRLWELERNIELRRFIGHTASVWSVAFSEPLPPNPPLRSGEGGRDASSPPLRFGEGGRGVRLALSGSADGSVRLWDVETGRELRRLDGHTALVSSVAFSPDGRKALSGGYDHTVVLWDLQTGQEVKRFKGPMRYINHVAFSPAGRRVLVCAEKSIRIFNVQTGQEVRRLEGHAGSVLTAIFSPDGGQVLSAGDDRTLRLWDVESGQEVRKLEGHSGSVRSLAFAGERRRALSGSADRTVRLWDLATGRELARFDQHADPVISVTATPDGQYVLSGSRESVIKWWQIKGLAGKGDEKRP